MEKHAKTKHGNINKNDFFNHVDILKDEHGQVNLSSFKRIAYFFYCVTEQNFHCSVHIINKLCLSV